MNFINNLSTAGKLYLGFGFILFLTVLIVISSYFSLMKTNKSHEQVVSVMRITHDLTQFRSDQNRMRVLVLEALISNDQAQKEMILEQLNQKQKEQVQLAKSIQVALAPFPEELAEFIEISVVIEEFMRNRDKQIEMLSKGQIKEAMEFSMSAQDSLYEKIWTDIYKLNTHLENHEEQVEAENRQLVRNEIITLFIMSGSLLFMAFLLIVWVRNMLRKIFSEVAEGVTVLGTAAAEILTTVTEVSTGASETSAAVSETTVTIEEIRQTATMANQKAQAVLESSHRAAEATIDGKISVQQAIDGMGRISQQMHLIAESVDQLFEKNRTISEITSTVTDIADQSNLLAVNAAIEAAKAGEYGRGFTVVAQEIRNLAEQSKKATAQVKDILNDIQRGMARAVSATEKGSLAVEEGSKLALQSGNMIDLLAETVTEAAQSVMQISASNQQQLAGMDQIVPAMENIEQASEQNVMGTRQIQLAAQNINELGKKLKDVVEKYKI